MSEPEQILPQVLDNEDWINRWDKRNIGFHRECIHPVLEKHVSLMEDGRSNLRILVPLCGKSWDMKWLADRGHTVIGVEVAQRAIQEFFEEQKIPFTSEPVPALDGTVFQSEDKKINIYSCDFFKISVETVGSVNAVWDRGSMVAINVSDRERYGGVMQALMTPDCRYLLSALQYDETKYAGPPHHLGDQAIQEAFGSTCTVKEVDCEDVTEPKHREKWGIEWLNEKTFLIMPQK